MSGVIYFIGYGDTGIVKIGYATTLKSRFSQLQVSSPEPLEIIATVPGTMAREQALHRALGGHCKRGEWFKPTPLVKLITEKAANGCSLDDLIAFADDPDPSDKKGQNKLRQRLYYARMLQDEMLPDLWRERYTLWLQELEIEARIKAEMAVA